jgi:AmiR/NasT family two-component response regulator
MSATRVLLLADGNPAVLETVKRMLESEFEAIGAISDGSLLITEAEKLKPDVWLKPMRGDFGRTLYGTGGL